MTDTYLCIHGHFYQPPRDNPWPGFIEAQPSARSNHDWNERITRECYVPNLTARLLGPGGRIKRLLNNYGYLNFNYGPTLLSWMEKVHPEVCAGIIEADRACQNELNKLMTEKNTGLTDDLPADLREMAHAPVFSV